MATAGRFRRVGHGGDGRARRLARSAVVGRHRGPGGTTTAGFPNLCLVIGPNTGLGDNSMVHIIESQLNYIDDYVSAVQGLGGTAALDARADARRRWNERVQRRMERTVWAAGDWQSWYLQAAGRNPTLWLASALGFRRATRRLSLAESHVLPAGDGR
jgi:hypothetical protein